MWLHSTMMNKMNYKTLQKKKKKKKQKNKNLESICNQKFVERPQ